MRHCSPGIDIKIILSRDVFCGALDAKKEAEHFLRNIFLGWIIGLISIPGEQCLTLVECHFIRTKALLHHLNHNFEFCSSVVGKNNFFKTCKGP